MIMKKILLTISIILLSVRVLAQPEYLEGDIIYYTYRSFSESVQQQSPEFINGVDTIYLTIKGNRVHENHKNTGIHIVYDNNERILMWSDNTKEGFSLPYIIQIPEQRMDMYETNEKKIIAGREGQLFKHVTDIMGVVLESSLFVSDTDIPVAPNAICILNVSSFGRAFENKIGIKYISEQYQNGGIQEMGKLAMSQLPKGLPLSKKQKEQIMQQAVQSVSDIWSTQLSELIAIHPREVNDEEFSVPSEYKLAFVEKIEPSGQLQNPMARMEIEKTLNATNEALKKQGLGTLSIEDVDAANVLQSYKKKLLLANKQYMQRHGMLSEQKSKERIVYNIEEEWDF